LRNGHDLAGQVIDTRIEPAPVFGQSFNDAYRARR
jgi:hypothetical protein